MTGQDQPETQQRPAGGLLQELQRRKVFRAAGAYLLASWVLLQVADVLFPALSLPDWTIRLVAALLILGFPLVLIFAWAFELSRQGISPDRGPGDGAGQTAHTRTSQEDSARPGQRRIAVAVLAVVLIAGTAWLGVDRLLQLQPAASPPREKSIAVLPFADMSPAGDQEYFADGISEELLNLLAKVPELRVIGRTSAFQFKGKQEDLRRIGDTLGVTHILDGSVRKYQGTVRITAQLVDTRDGSSVWSERFDRSIDNILAVQDEIAASVVTSLQGQLLGQVALRSDPLTAAGSAAYDLYLKGQHFMRQLEPTRALEYFRKASDLDPTMASAWSGLSSAYTNQLTTGTLSPQDGLPLIREANQRALALNPSLADAHYQDGFVKLAFELDRDGAFDAFRRAVEFEPNHAGAMRGLAALETTRGRFDRAIEYIEDSVRLDPLSLPSMHNRAFTYYLSEEYETAAGAIRDALDFAGAPYPVGNYILTIILLGQGRVEEAVLAAREEPAQQFRLAAESLALYAAGDDETATAVLDQLTSGFADKAATHIAYVHAWRGASDEAVRWLYRALDQREPNIVQARYHPLLRSLADDRGYQAFLAHAGLLPDDQSARDP
jgi:adenylate cyclase